MLDQVKSFIYLARCFPYFDNFSTKGRSILSAKQHQLYSWIPIRKIHLLAFEPTPRFDFLDSCKCESTYTPDLITGFACSCSPGLLVHPYAMWLTSSMLLRPGGGGGETTVCLLHASSIWPRCVWSIGARHEGIAPVARVPFATVDASHVLPPASNTPCSISATSCDASPPESDQWLAPTFRSV
jgi:hypothetical protein